MTLEYRVAKLELEMSDLKSGSVKLPTRSSFSTPSFGDLAFPSLYIGSLFVMLWVGVDIGEDVGRHNASHNTAASVSGPVNPPGLDTSEDPR
jgi:hypothetical protein